MPVDFSNDPKVKVVDLSDDPKVLVDQPDQQAGGVPEPPKELFGTNKKNWGIQRSKTWTESLRDNLPAVGAAVGGLAGTAASGGALLPIGMAALTAAGGKGIKDAIRYNQELPTPPTELDAVSELGQVAALGGATELGGQALGWAGKKIGNVVARRGAAAKNNQLVEQIVNPQNRKMNEWGHEAAKPIQAKHRADYKDKRGFLEKTYDKLLGSKFGQARKIEVTDDVLEPNVIADAPDAFTIQDTPTFYAKEGPSIAEIHATRGEAGGRFAASRMKQIEEIAHQHGMDPAPYQKLTDAWRNLMDTYGPRNKFHKMTQGLQEEKLIDKLTKPGSWPTFEVTRPNGQKVTLSNKDLVRMYRETVGEELWAPLQTAVQKNLVASAKVGDKIDGTVLEKNLRAIDKFGGRDLFPAYDQLKEVAGILAKDTGAQGVPHTGKTFAVINWALRHMDLDSPSLQRLLKQSRGEKDIIETVIEHIVRTGAVGGQVAYSKTMEDSEIPEPPMARSH